MLRYDTPLESIEGVTCNFHKQRNRLPFTIGMLIENKQPLLVLNRKNAKH